MINHRGGGHRAHLVGRLRMAGTCVLIAAPLIVLAAGCGSLEAIGDFPNPKDTVTVFTTPPPAPASGVVATVAPSVEPPVAELGR